MQQQQQACMLHDCTFALMHVIAIYLPTANVSLIMCSCTLHLRAWGPNLHGCIACRRDDLDHWPGAQATGLDLDRSAAGHRTSL